MKRHLVAGLIRLYPSRWRADYGEELSRLASTGFQLAQSDFAPLQGLMYCQPGGGKGR